MMGSNSENKNSVPLNLYDAYRDHKKAEQILQDKSGDSQDLKTLLSIARSRIDNMESIILKRQKYFILEDMRNALHTADTEDVFTEWIDTITAVSNVAEDMNMGVIYQVADMDLMIPPRMGRPGIECSHFKITNDGEVPFDDPGEAEKYTRRFQVLKPFIMWISDVKLVGKSPHQFLLQLTHKASADLFYFAHRDVSSDAIPGTGDTTNDKNAPKGTN